MANTAYAVLIILFMAVLLDSPAAASIRPDVLPYPPSFPVCGRSAALSPAPSGRHWFSRLSIHLPGSFVGGYKWEIIPKSSSILGL
jgi:hypothetical protein